MHSGRELDISENKSLSKALVKLC